MNKISWLICLAICVLILAGCSTVPSATPVVQPATATLVESLPTAISTNASTQPPAQESATQPGSAGNAIPSFPPLDQSIPAGIVPSSKSSQYTIFTWNNLGMHCYMFDYSRFLVLPPYNTFWAQVVAKGSENPQIISSIQLKYSIPSVTQPENHTNFWQFAKQYGFDLQPGVGLTGKKTSGTMDAKSDHYIAEGVPAIDYSDDGNWDPYPFYKVQAVDTGGNILAESFNVSPVSSEMRCDLCHGGATVQELEDNILKSHDKNNGTQLYDQAASGKLVMCSACHADPALGVTKSNGSQFSLSAAMHTFHSDKGTSQSNLPQNFCQSCHPGEKTQCLRDAMFEKGITCTDCHGSMSEVGASTRTAWVNLPKCSSCHGQNLGKSQTRQIDSPNTKLTASESELYRNSKAHGGTGIYCAACHGSPHAIYPTVTNRDNQYSIYLQGSAGVIRDCTVCHGEAQDEGFWHFGEGD
jgi:hypothetical protein